MHGSWFLSRTSLEVASRPPGLHPQIRICLLSFNAINNTSALQPPQPHTTTVLRPFFWDHPGEPVPEENFWTLWCKGRLTETDTPTIRLGATPSRLTSAHLHYSPIELTQRYHKNSCTIIWTHSIATKTIGIYVNVCILPVMVMKNQ